MGKRGVEEELVFKIIVFAIIVGLFLGGAYFFKERIFAAIEYLKGVLGWG
jgi:hypothetical protein